MHINNFTGSEWYAIKTFSLKPVVRYKWNLLETVLRLKLVYVIIIEIITGQRFIKSVKESSGSKIVVFEEFQLFGIKEKSIKGCCI